MGVMLRERIPRQLKVVEDGYTGVPTIINNPRTRVALEYKSLAETWQYARSTGKLIGSHFTMNIKQG